FLLFISFHHPPTTNIYTLSLHDALPICKLASRPEFWFQGDLSLAEHRARVLGQLHTLVKEDAVHRAFPKRFGGRDDAGGNIAALDRKSTRLNSSHVKISYAVFCLKKKT